MRWTDEDVAKFRNRVETKKRQFRDYERTPDKKLNKREQEKVREALHEHMKNGNR